MSYKPIFSPDGDTGQAGGDEPVTDLGDSFPGYVYSKPITLAVNVALATGRPLVLRGAPGCGKSSLARDVARRKGWRYYEQVISSRTQAQDLLWRFDAVRRLGDAQAGSLAGAAERAARYGRMERYLQPGVFWWAFDRESARRRGLPAGEELEFPAPEEPGEARDHPRVVVLLDEIDKAEPDVPNDLLVPLGAMHFTVSETETVVAADPRHLPFLVITSNDERDLPAAFLRRCVVLSLEAPKKARLIEIAQAHFPEDRFPGAGLALLNRIAERYAEFRSKAEEARLRTPGTAEFLDTVRACLRLGVDENSPEWAAITQATLWKHPQPPGAEP